MPALLALFDGNSLVHRAYHAVPGLTTTRGELVNAVYGFAMMLTRALADLRSTHAAVSFDLSAPTFRHLRSERYKAHRPRMDDGLRPQFDRVRQLTRVLRIPIYEIPGFEADDLLGTLARQAERDDVDAVIVTGDNDALQLVGPRVRVLTPKLGFKETVLFDALAVREKYGLEPGQIVDFKALKGDTSDNIKGVPGIGEKTAQKLLTAHGSLDRLLEVAATLEPKVSKLLTENAEQARESRFLAAIDTNAPVTLDLEACRLGGFDREELIELLRELEFKSLLNRLPAIGEMAASPAATATVAAGGGQLTLFGEPAAATGERSGGAGGADGHADGEVPYAVVATAAELDRLVRRLERAPAFAFDTETSDADAVRADLVGISVAPAAGEAYYVPVGHRGEDVGEQLDLETVRTRLGPLLADPAKPKLAHNAKFDIVALEQAGFQVEGVTVDTMLASYLLESSQRALGLKDLAFTKLGVEMTPIAGLIGKGKQQISFSQVPIARAAAYAAADADMTLRLAQEIVPELSPRLRALLDELEMPLIPVLVDMERVGVAVDVDYLKQISTALTERIGVVETMIFNSVGHRFNINSPIQLGSVLFDELRLPTRSRTRTGQASTDAETLESLKGAHDVVDMILEFRQLGKLKSTYVDALPLLINPRTGRIHTSFNQTGTITGRISSSEPNLQNIPIRTELGRDVRRAFVAGRAGHILIAADYSQIELRILAHITGDPRLVAAFHAGEDVHVATAAEVLNVPIESVTSNQRRLAKMINYGIAYGLSDWGLARYASIPQHEAAHFIDSYLGRYVGIATYIAETKRRAEELGYVETISGRRCYIPEINVANHTVRMEAQRRAINAPIQGSSADIMKRAMIDVYRRMKREGLRAELILQVHDELVFEVPRDEVERLSTIAREEMIGAARLSVPFEVDVKVGATWADVA